MNGNNDSTAVIQEAENMNADAMCTKPVRLFPGACIRLSTFYYKWHEGKNPGVRVSLWKDGTWVRDIEREDTEYVDHIIIPKNCNEISFALLQSEENKYVYIFGNKDFDDSKAIMAMIRQQYPANKKFEGKTVSILGDSVSTFGGKGTIDDGKDKWSDGVYTYEGNRVRYPNGYVVNVNETWWMRLINRNKMKLLVNDSWAGSRVSWDGKETEKVGEHIHMASLTRIKHLGEKGNPDIILVFGGSNDLINGVSEGNVNAKQFKNVTEYTEEEIANLNVSEFADAYLAMIVRLKYYYPNAEIICILPYLLYYDKLKVADSAPAKIESYHKIIKEICNYYGIKTVDARKCGLGMFDVLEDFRKKFQKKFFVRMDNNEPVTIPKYLKDDLHPDKEGMNLLFHEVNRI